MTPTELRVIAEGRGLIVAWEDGGWSRCDARRLRESSRAATAIRASIDGTSTGGDEEIRVTAISLVGLYGVQLTFSDGHDRGIYPWTLLRDLAEETA
jgi:DUF971 family protein